MRKVFSFSFLVTQAPVLVAVLGIALLNWTYSRNLSETREAVAHSLRVNDAIGAVLSQVQDIELGQRGYLLTRDAQYLEPYERSRVAVGDTVAGLRNLVSDNAVQTAHIAQMEALVRDKLEEIDSTLQMTQTGRTADAIAEVKSNRGKVIMDTLRSLIGDMRQAERLLLESRSEAMRKTDGLALLVVLAGLGLTIAARIISALVGVRLSQAGPTET